MITEDISGRQDAEKAFHDLKFASERKQDYNELGFKRIIFRRFLDTIGDMEGKRVLEFGCGDGWFTKILASKGAEVWAFDISGEAVKKTRALMEANNFQDRVHLDQMVAEQLTYEKDMFDLVVGVAVLHHLDLKSWIREIRRVLKDGGRACFMEPLGHNPLLNLYRRLTPSLRSEDEIPMRFEQFPLIEDSFMRFEHEEYYLVTMFSLAWYFLGMKKLMLRSRDLLYRLDKILLRGFPKLSKHCWYSILMMEK